MNLRRVMKIILLFLWIILNFWIISSFWVALDLVPFFHINYFLITVYALNLILLSWFRPMVTKTDNLSFFYFVIYMPLLFILIRLEDRWMFWFILVPSIIISAYIQRRRWGMK